MHRADVFPFQTWAALERLLPTGKVRHIGVSNFDSPQLTNLLSHATVKPAVHQFELHPYLQQRDFVAWHRAHGISVTAYSPLANTNPTYSTPPGKDTDAPPLLLRNNDIVEIARKRGYTSAQVALAWGIGRGTSVIPKSQHADRIRENFGALESKLQEEDLDIIKGIGERIVWRFNNPSEDWGVPLFRGLDDAN